MWSDRQRQSRGRSKITQLKRLRACADMLDVGQEAHRVTGKPSQLCYKSSAGRRHGVGVEKKNPLSFYRGLEAGNQAAAMALRWQRDYPQLSHHRCLLLCHRFHAQPPPWPVLLIMAVSPPDGPRRGSSSWGTSARPSAHR